MTSSVSGAADLYIYLSTSNQLAQITLATGGTRGFTYDASGNVIAESRPGGTYSYSYNAAGRMNAFSINGMLQATYTYDAMGRQAIRSLTSPSPVTIHSVFDSQGRRIAEYDEATGGLLREYVWNGWEPVAVIEGGVVSFVRADHIGRPVFATSATGAKVWEVSYLPFGGVRVATGSPTAARFPGQWFQAESGLHQNWMRDYDPTTGRYLEADPLGLVDGASVYGYVRQNPGNYMDPRGEFGVAGAAVGAVVSLGLQMFVNIAYGDMGLWQAMRCIDIVPVINGALMGGFGASPGALLKSGRGVATAAGALGLGVQMNRAAPNVYLDGNQCDECTIQNPPPWVQALKDVIL